MDNEQKDLTSNSRVSWQTYEDGIIVLDHQSKKVHEFNHTAAWIWTFIVDNPKYENLVQEYMNRFDIEKDMAETDVQNFISSAQEWGLIK